MRLRDERRFSHFHQFIDVEAVEEALCFEPTRQTTNKRGDLLDVGYCPDPWQLHKNGDSTGKFALNRESRRYNCWVCGGGTLVDLVMALRDLDEQQAEDWLYQFTAPPDEANETFLSEIEGILRQEKLAAPVMPYYNEHVLDKWTANLPRIEKWLRGRGISEEIAMRARIGFQPDAKRMAPLKAGKSPGAPYSGPSVYLPHFWGARLVGWQQRWLDEDRPKWIPKYTNTSSFPRTETLHGYEEVYLADRPIIVVESVPTRLFLASLGYPAVATFGGSVSAEQMRLLRLCQQGLVLAPDNDGPGRKWLDYTEEEKHRRQYDRMILAEYLTKYVPVKVGEPVGDFGSGSDWADLLSEGLPFARNAVRLLYEEAEYY